MNKSTRRIVGVAAGVAVVLVLVWYVALMRPQSHDLVVAHAARATAEQQISQLNSQVAALQALTKQVPSDRSRLAVADAALPNNPSLDTAVVQLHQAATAAGVALSSVGPSTPVVTTPAVTTPAVTAATTTGSATTPIASQPAAAQPFITLTMSASGSYQQLTAFIRALTAMHRAIVVDSLSLNGTSKLTASIGARIFYAGSPTP